MPTKKSLHSVEAVFDDFYAIRAPPQAAFPDVMFPGIAARCISHGNVLLPVLLSLCCAFLPQSSFRVPMCVVIVVRFIGRSSQQAPQHSFPHHGF